MVLFTLVNVLDFFVALALSCVSFALFPKVEVSLELKFIDRSGGPELADLSVDMFLYFCFYFLVAAALYFFNT